MHGDDDPGSSSFARASSAEQADSALTGDTLSSVLSAVRLSGALFFVIDARPPWLAEAPDAAALAPAIVPGSRHVISYHLILGGSCFCALPGRPPVRLVAGDVVVIPHGDAYAMSSAAQPFAPSPAESLLPFFTQMAQGALPRTLREGGSDGERIHLACGFLGCDALPFNPVVAALPRLLHLPHATREPGDRLASLIEFALAESHAPRAGSDCVLLRVSELLFVELLRRYVAGLPEQQEGWLSGLRDPTVGRALALLHHGPAEAWTIERLAERAGVSRSALAARFAQLVGQPPMQYLTSWRMQLAARLLADGGTKVSAVALAVGYDSEAAFSRAFKKAAGASPSIWRQQRATR